MAWIIVILAGLLLGAILIGSRTARTVLIGLAVLLVLGAGWLIYQEKMREHDARTLISPDEVELRDATVDQVGGLYYLVTSVKNLSGEHAIHSLRIRVQAHDCPEARLSEACETVGDQQVHVTVRVPPQQVRGIRELSPFANLPQATVMMWTFDVAEVRAVVE
jgi:hypothetical protein